MQGGVALVILSIFIYGSKAEDVVLWIDRVRAHAADPVNGEAPGQVRALSCHARVAHHVSRLGGAKQFKVGLGMRPMEDYHLVKQIEPLTDGADEETAIVPLDGRPLRGGSNGGR